MARETRAATGNSKPRIFPVVEEKPATTKKVAKPKTKANTTAKRTPAAKGSKPTGVTKKKAPAAKKAKTPTTGDVVKGEVKKAVGTVTKNPAKKAAGTKKVKGETGAKAATKKK